MTDSELLTSRSSVAGSGGGETVPPGGQRVVGGVGAGCLPTPIATVNPAAKKEELHHPSPEKVPKPRRLNAFLESSIRIEGPKAVNHAGGCYVIIRPRPRVVRRPRGDWQAGEMAFYCLDNRDATWLKEQLKKVAL